MGLFCFVFAFFHGKRGSRDDGSGTRSKKWWHVGSVGSRYFRRVCWGDFFSFNGTPCVCVCVLCVVFFSFSLRQCNIDVALPPGCVLVSLGYAAHAAPCAGLDEVFVHALCLLLHEVFSVKAEDLHFVVHVRKDFAALEKLCRRNVLRHRYALVLHLKGRVVADERGAEGKGGRG